MFGRRRHAAAEVPAAPVPQLTDAQILELVHTTVAELIGENGEWTVNRRSADDTDAIFHSILAQSVAVDITAAIVDARNRLQAGEPVAQAAVPSAPQHLASEPAHVAEPAAEEPVEQEEPAAMAWEPAPITVWTDLRKPVTGEIPAVEHVERPAA
ncbi:hypothetical protein [uncultured Leifsonia sp.]|uniref:hypothetical protein n=1 Tax=Leifsonia sp. TaxID=1870902 RepID=UPI0028D5B5A6|nr:hypothetical protein [uncultured Leifsonia sp.]